MKSRSKTGAKDRHGKDIREGDKVRYLRSKYGVGPSRGNVGVVRWDDVLLRWGIYSDGEGKLGELTVPKGFNLEVV